MDQSTKVKKRTNNCRYEFIKWAYGHRFAVIDQFDVYGDIVRRFIGIAKDYGIELEEGES